MMDAPQQPKIKPRSLWASYGPTYAVEKYDFQVWKRSNPPDIDAEPIIKKFPDTKKAP